MPRALALLAVALLAVSSWACGGSDSPLTIPPFDRGPTTIQVGDVLSLLVSLNRPAPAETTVDVLVEQSLAAAIGLDRTQMVFPAGVKQQTLEISGRSTTNGAFAKILFTITENGARQLFQVKID